MPDDMIDPESGVPPYLQVAAILRRQIMSGELTGMVPSESRLMQTYGIARNTARKVFAVLVDEGLVYRVPGWGTFVRREETEGPSEG